MVLACSAVSALASKQRTTVGNERSPTDSMNSGSRRLNDQRLILSLIRLYKSELTDNRHDSTSLFSRSSRYQQGTSTRSKAKRGKPRTLMGQMLPVYLRTFSAISHEKSRNWPFSPKNRQFSLENASQPSSGRSALKETASFPVIVQNETVFCVETPRCNNKASSRPGIPWMRF